MATKTFCDYCDEEIESGSSWWYKQESDGLKDMCDMCHRDKESA
jgi:hypothetical protein